jgi:hypothetical protein
MLSKTMLLRSGSAVPSIPAKLNHQISNHDDIEQQHNQFCRSEARRLQAE